MILSEIPPNWFLTSKPAEWTRIKHEPVQVCLKPFRPAIRSSISQTAVENEVGVSIAAGDGVLPHRACLSFPDQRWGQPIVYRSVKIFGESLSSAMTIFNIETISPFITWASKYLFFNEILPRTDGMKLGVEETTSSDVSRVQELPQNSSLEIEKTSKVIGSAIVERRGNHHGQFPNLYRNETTIAVQNCANLTVFVNEKRRSRFTIKTSLGTSTICAFF